MSWRVTNNTRRLIGLTVGDKRVWFRQAQSREDLDLSGEEVVRAHARGLTLEERVPAEEEEASETPSRLDVFRGIVDTLTADDMTADDMPKVDALNARLPEGAVLFDAAERDALWEQRG